MKDQKRRLTLLIMSALLSFGCYSQAETTILYHISIAEIDSEAAVKEADYLLRPIFDVPGTFNHENGIILFETTAHIKKEQLEERLLINGYHLETFEIKQKEVRL